MIRPPLVVVPGTCDSPGGGRVTFADVAGINEVKDQLLEVRAGGKGRHMRDSRP